MEIGPRPLNYGAPVLSSFPWLSGQGADVDADVSVDWVDGPLITEKGLGEPVNNWSVT